MSSSGAGRRRPNCFVFRYYDLVFPNPCGVPAVASFCKKRLERRRSGKRAAGDTKPRPVCENEEQAVLRFVYCCHSCPVVIVSVTWMHSQAKIPCADFCDPFSAGCGPNSRRFAKQVNQRQDQRSKRHDADDNHNDYCQMNIEAEIRAGIIGSQRQRTQPHRQTQRRASPGAPAWLPRFFCRDPKLDLHVGLKGGARAARHPGEPEPQLRFWHSANTTEQGQKTAGHPAGRQMHYMG